MTVERRKKGKARETRSYPFELTVKQQENGRTAIEGYASVTESPYDMFDRYGPFVETIKRGAFAKTLRENPQVQLLLNHGGLSMAHTDAGHLRMAEDEHGLHIRAEVNPNRTDVRDMLLALEDRDVAEMSFAFRVIQDDWSEDYSERTIREISLKRGDVSVVNFGANPATEVAVRAHDLANLDTAAARALYERLGSILAAEEAVPAPVVDAPLSVEIGHPVDLLRMQAQRLALGR